MRKSSLVLIEQLVMLLVFALAATLCLQAFAASSQISRQSAARDQAVLQVQNMAEALKACRGDYTAAASLLDGQWDGTQLICRFDASWQSASDDQSTYQVCATPEQNDVSLLGSAQIGAFSADGSCLFSLSVAWQKEAADE